MKIKSTIVVATAAGAAFAPNAAEAQSRSAGPGAMAAPVYNWTGFYAGAHLGYAWQQNTTAGTYVDGATRYPFTNRTDPRGFVGGAQIGYNWQNGMLVYGVETDISVLGSGNATAVTNINTNDAIMTSTNRINWVGTFRGRLGVAVTPRTLIYGTGGLAYGGVRNEHVGLEDGFDISNYVANKVRAGFAAGGGVEHAVTDKVIVRLEGMHVDLGKQTLNAPTSGVCDTVCMPVTFTNKATMVRGGVNVRF